MTQRSARVRSVGRRVIPLALPVAALVACAPRTDTVGASPDPVEAPAAQAELRDAPWPIVLRPHVDLWLHGFALLTEDTAHVPYFRRGYREEMAEIRGGANVLTQLDANRDELRARFRVNRQLELAQFVPLYFGSWPDLLRAIDYFLQVEGEPRRVSNREAQQALAVLATYFPTAADREWLRVFTASLRDEWEDFYRQYWHQRVTARDAALARLDTIWHERVRPGLTGFLNNTQQATGDFIIAMPLDGEGRTIQFGGRRLVATAFPQSREDAIEPVFVLVHELVGNVTGPVIADQTSPAEKREGVERRLSGNALVRGGELLLRRTIPDLAEQYAEYYLRAGGHPVPATGATAALARAYPLPEPILEAITRQLDVVLGGI